MHVTKTNPVLWLQTLGLLPVEMDAAAVARFLRCCPGLNKQTVGELLGEHDEFFLEVLRRFTDTFEFSGGPSVLCGFFLLGSYQFFAV